MFGVGMGPSGEEKQQYQNLSGVSSTVANMGLGDVTQSSDFMKAILSGDPTKIGQVLGPQIKGIKQQGQQQKQTMAQFGTRSGGNTAAANNIDNTTRSTIDDLIASLTGSAVSGLSSQGTSLLGAGIQGFGDAFGQASVMQKQNSAKWNDIFKSIGDVASGVATGFSGG